MFISKKKQIFFFGKKRINKGSNNNININHPDLSNNASNEENNKKNEDNADNQNNRN